MTGYQVTRLTLFQRWRRFQADLRHILATGVEPAAHRRVRRARPFTLKQHRLHYLTGIGLRDRRHQRLSIGMLGRIIERLGRCHLNDLPQIHHRDPVADVGNGGQVVGDEQES